ncbi:hypothetical protein [Vibrio sp. WXL103]|uniref:hypothetical protein n=1 Tax=unclassified Vibrio TaxID=2614977 RepID=UPI003EC81BED
MPQSTSAPVEPSATNKGDCLKLGQAYQGARKYIEATEVELQRSRIMMMDAEGNLRPLNLYPEH